MDAVLVLVTNHNFDLPRQSVAYVFTNTAKPIFHSFRHFSATDAELAQEVVEELKLRNVDLRATRLNQRTWSSSANGTLSTVGCSH